MPEGLGTLQNPTTTFLQIPNFSTLWTCFKQKIAIQQREISIAVRLMLGPCQQPRISTMGQAKHVCCVWWLMLPDHFCPQSILYNGPKNQKIIRIIFCVWENQRAVPGNDANK